jgi:hypothetical protein
MRERERKRERERERESKPIFEACLLPAVYDVRGSYSGGGVR